MSGTTAIQEWQWTVRTTALHYRAVASPARPADLELQDLDWSMTRNGVESLDFNMSMPDWEKCRRIGEEPWVSDIRVKRTASICWCGSSRRRTQPEYKQCTVLVQCDSYLNLIDARYLNGRGKLSYRRCLKSQEVQEKPNGDIVSPGVVGSTAPVYDVTNGRLGKISMLKRCPRGS